MRKILVLLLLLMPGIGFSSWCPTILINKQYEMAELVFIGTVTKEVEDSIAISTISQEGDTTITYEPSKRYTLTVDKMYKGQHHEEIVMSDDLFFDYYFAEGATYIVFALQHGKNYVTSICFCTGKLEARKTTMDWLEKRSKKEQQKKWIRADNLSDSASTKMKLTESGFALLQVNESKKEGVYTLWKKKIVIRYMDYKERVEERQVLPIIHENETHLLIKQGDEIIKLIKRQAT